ncbi:hypothetical protein GGX14DRAFT_402885 [Mycena pura]|uniref:Uncharacterized protein n=1 Tax=Mycena pura TaxID=153505 RepID=A0AAD6V0Y6_9AGAR|nr:hypothetical protein GGX14DRAFT_402885 [Mycena pura]
MVPHLEYNGEQVRCLVCARLVKNGAGNWISRKNLKAHLATPTHLASFDSTFEMERIRTEDHQHLSQAYDAAGSNDLPHINASELSQVPSMFPPEPEHDSMDVDLPPVNFEILMEQLGVVPEPEELSPEATRLLLQREFEQMLEDAYEETHHLGANIDEQFIADELPKAGDEDDDDIHCFDAELVEGSEYFPYPNKTVMLLDIMDNLPRCRFTGDQISLILHFASKLGVADVPSLKGFRKIQQKLQSHCGNKPVKSISHLGNVFYMNDIRETLAADMANPLVAPHLHFYPEETSGPLSETFQAERWMEYTPSQLTPMYLRGHKRWWIEELAKLRDGRYIIPHTWISRNGELTTDVSFATRTENGRWRLQKDIEETIHATELALDFDDIRAEFGARMSWVEEDNVPAMPNAMRGLVEDDEDLFVLMVSPWADDVSGNRSKQYNKHMNMCAGNGCLPGRLLKQEFNVHYISTSPHASSAKQFVTFRDHVKSTETEPVKCFNAATKRKSRFIIRTPGLTGDNPQQSDEASHMGSNANYPCRKCRWGGTQKEKESVEHYHSCHLTGTACSAAEIRDNLAKQHQLATHGDKKELRTYSEAPEPRIKSRSIGLKSFLRKPVKCVWRCRGLARKTLRRGFRIGLISRRDTPVELLHTVLLGVMKYIWHMLNTSQWSDEDRHLLAVRLQSTDISGLTIPPIRAGYMIQYRNNLIGKHFKTLMQILIFHVHRICTSEQFVLIKAAGELGARLWVPEIDNMEEYLAQLIIAVANLLDAFDAVDPLRILVKIKLHLLAHLPNDIRRFGPGIRFSTEIYEAFNGGYWREHTSERWIQAGGAVQKVLQNDPVFQRHLGWVPQPKLEPGKVKSLPARKKPDVEWKHTVASRYWSEMSPPIPQSSWKLGSSVITQSGDIAPLGSWVFALDSGGKTIIGRIHELLLGPNSLITMERFILGSQPHPDFGWPILRRPRGTEITEQGILSFIILPTTSVQHLCCVEHDCQKGDCQPTLKSREFQEREATDREIGLIKHADDDHFVLNLSALHNFVRVCRALPQHVTELKPLIQDRVEFHKEASLKAQAARMTKRQQTAARKRAKAAAKKSEAEEAEAAARRAENLEEEEGEEESDKEEQGESSGQASGDKEAEDIEDIAAIVPRRTQRMRKRRRVCDSDSENSEVENEDLEMAVTLETRRQSTRQRRAPNRLDL